MVRGRRRPRKRSSVLTTVSRRPCTSCLVVSAAPTLCGCAFSARTSSPQPGSVDRQREHHFWHPEADPGVAEGQWVQGGVITQVHRATQIVRINMPTKHVAIEAETVDVLTRYAPVVHAAPSLGVGFCLQLSLYTAPAPVVECVSPALAVSCVAPRPSVYVALAPVVEYISPASAVYTAPAPVFVYISFASAVYAAPTPVVDTPLQRPSAGKVLEPWCTSPSCHVGSSAPGEQGKEVENETLKAFLASLIDLN